MMRMGIPTVTVTASMLFLPPSPRFSIHESTVFRQSFRQALLVVLGAMCYVAECGNHDRQGHLDQFARLPWAWMPTVRAGAACSRTLSDASLLLRVDGRALRVVVESVRDVAIRWSRAASRQAIEGRRAAVKGQCRQAAPHRGSFFACAVWRPSALFG
jgi:hypothetical protein